MNNGCISMSKTDGANPVVDTVNFGILSHIAKFLDENKLEDLTQVQDEYILRQMARLGCFSILDVVRARNELAQKYNYPV